ncbi:MAG: SDR family oxidoreductase [Burkholderiales bacterium]|nr:SDR family oxidoreductase [Anaerolineae bacterium]
MITIDLSGKNALVIGGTSGIGKGIALALAQAGANVVATSRSPQPVAETAVALRTLGVNTLEITCDADNLASVRALFEAIHAEWGKLDILVNSQGITKKKPPQDYEDELFARILETNLHSVFRVCREAYPLLKASGGSIINIASLASFIGLTESPAYSASKGGVVQLTKVLAVDWAKDGIRCNAIAPGWILTPLSEPILQIDKYREPIMRRIPMQRFGTVDDVSGAALYLASDLARYVTGSVLTVDGGALAGI